MNVWNRGGSSAVPSVDDGRDACVLVGREQESAVLERLLTEHHLVTVTGRAGVGKSRLAAAAGRTRGPWRRVVHVRWQSNGPGASGALTAAVFEALTGRRPHSGEAGVNGVLRHLPATGVLLFLDDVDPVHRESVGMVQRLLVAVPGLRVLVTSRRALGLGEEQVLRLEPLATGARGGGAAVELFLSRARAATEGFHVDGAGLRAVEAICRSLEGVPHAIELAAEQVALQPVHELVHRLERHQCWLRSERPALRRHRSVRETVGASYALCEREARIVWGRASAFAGAFSESSAVFVCAGGSVAPHQVPSLLVQLASVHVLESVGDPAGLRPTRYRMTRAARDFGTERLREAGEEEAAVERRVVHGRQVALVAESLWASGCQSQAVRLVQEEQDELTTALRQALNRPDQAELALDTVVGLWFWWALYDRAEEGRDHLLRLLPRCPNDSTAVMRGRWLAAWLSAGHDQEAARKLLGRIWPAAVMAGDDAVLGHIAHVNGVIALHEGNPRAAAEHFEEAARTIPDQPSNGPSPAMSLAAKALAETAFATGAARRTARRVLTMPGHRDDAWAGALARYAMAFVDHCHGRSGRAWRRAHRTLAELERTLAAPHGCTALRALIADIKTGSPGRLPSGLGAGGPRGAAQLAACRTPEGQQPVPMKS